MAKLVHKEQSYTGGGDTSDLIKWSEAKTSVKKNLLKNSLKSGTLNGYTKTANSDGTVTINGSPVDSSVITVFDLVNTELLESWTIEAGTYEMSCEGLVLNDSYMAITYVTKDNQTVYDFVRIPERTGTFTITAELLANIKNWYIGLVIMAGKTISNVTYKPMIRLASIADATYEPYIPDNTELMRYSDNAVLGAKNLLPNNVTNKTVGGVTLTVNSDGSITVSGTATQNIIEVIDNHAFDVGSYILSGCPIGGSSSNGYSLVVDTKGYDTGNGFEFQISASAVLAVKLIITNGTEITTPITFYPMIRLATDTDDTYVPYAKTNKELTDAHNVKTIQVAITGWTSDTSSQSGTTLYKKTIALSHVYVTSPIVDIGASGVLPTVAQQEAYDLLSYVTINGTTLTLYGTAIPSTAYYINITGVD